MILGLVGAHRVGKTTLAEEYAAESGMLFMKTSTSEIFKDLGVDTDSAIPFDVRMNVQEAVLAKMVADYEKTHHLDGIITDRTPLDLIAYTMCDAAYDQVPQNQQKRFADYVEKCFEVTNEYFGTLVVVQPGIEIKPAPGKGAMNLAYMEHLNTIVLGLVSDSRLRVRGHAIPRKCLDIKKRLDSVRAVHNLMIGAHSEEFAIHIANGGRVN